MLKVSTPIIVFFLFTFTFNSKSQITILDSTFNYDGIVKSVFDDFTNAKAVVVQPDGKIIVAGNYQHGLGYQFLAIRYMEDGSVDSMFANNGFQIVPASKGLRDTYSIALQTDGKIVIAADYYGNYATGFGVVRLNSNGTFDTSFANKGIATIDVEGKSTWCFDVSIQSDGKILALGSTYVDINQDILLVRYNTDGSLDSTFGNKGKIITDINGEYDLCQSMTIQSDGKIVAGGYTGNNYSDPIVLRYLSNGLPDSSFGTNGITKINSSYNSFGEDLVVLPNGKIAMSGYRTQTTDYYIMVYLLNSNGTPDSTFDTDGIKQIDLGTFDFGSSIAAQTDGKIVVAGTTNVNSNQEVVLIRLDADGSEDSIFSEDGIVTTFLNDSYCLVWDMTIQPDGKYIVVGTTSSTYYTQDIFLTRYISGYHVSSEDISLASIPISVYPNPSKDRIIISFNPNSSVPYSISITSINGGKEITLSSDAIKNAGLGKQEIDVSNFIPGVYLIEMKSHEYFEIAKLIITE